MVNSELIQINQPKNIIIPLRYLKYSVCVVQLVGVSLCFPIKISYSRLPPYQPLLCQALDVQVAFFRACHVLVQLESSWHLRLEHSMWIIFRRHRLHLRERVRPIAAHHLLRHEGIVQEDIRIPNTSLLGKTDHHLVRLLNQIIHVCIIRCKVPAP